MRDHIKEIDRRMGLFAVAGTSEGESLGYIDADGCPASTSVATMVVGNGKSAERLRENLAFGRGYGYAKLKMVSADLLVVEKNFWREHREAFEGCFTGDDRIFGMTVKKADKLPLEAKFLIMDNPIAAGTGVAATIEMKKEASKTITQLLSEEYGGKT